MPRSSSEPPSVRTSASWSAVALHEELHRDLVKQERTSVGGDVYDVWGSPCGGARSTPGDHKVERSERDQARSPLACQPAAAPKADEGRQGRANPDLTPTAKFEFPNPCLALPGAKRLAGDGLQFWHPTIVDQTDLALPLRSATSRRGARFRWGPSASLDSPTRSWARPPPSSGRRYCTVRMHAGTATSGGRQAAGEVPGQLSDRTAGPAGQAWHANAAA
ncbi:uncharacterized protein PSFLO_02726 [Pseudozyma flocculosa]|uniref:Uncharacterized protein n=1 Tax=Pseudozyma flocculosa TaxID=84751 RepID=A0A5C3EYC6_9BASI|nr:uncharacterized protein PSFLO_02726 [Pseudozyma flocculosa]